MTRITEQRDHIVAAVNQMANEAARAEGNAARADTFERNNDALRGINAALQRENEGLRKDADNTGLRQINDGLLRRNVELLRENEAHVAALREAQERIRELEGDLAIYSDPNLRMAVRVRSQELQKAREEIKVLTAMAELIDAEAQAWADENCLMQGVVEAARKIYTNGWGFGRWLAIREALEALDSAGGEQ